VPHILAVHARQPRPHHFLARTAAGSLAQTRRAPRLGHATAASTSWPPNDLGCTLQAALLESEERPIGYARYLFLDPRAKDSCLERETVAHDPVASLRSQAGRALPDSTLTAVSGDLSAHSKELQKTRAANVVRFHHTGDEAAHHSIAGRLEFPWEAMQLPSIPASHG